ALEVGGQVGAAVAGLAEAVEDAAEEGLAAADGEALAGGCDGGIGTDAARVAVRKEDGLVAAEADDLGGEEGGLAAALDGDELAVSDVGDCRLEDEAGELGDAAESREGREAGEEGKLGGEDIHWGVRES